MTDQEVDLKAMVTEGQHAEPAELSDTELKASEKGWVPEEQWEGDPDQWRPAKEFLDRGELMDRISSQSKTLNKQASEIEEMKEALKVFAEHNKKIAEAEYNKALKELRSRKVDALDMGDHDAVLEIDDQIADLRDTKREIDEAEKAKTTQQDTPQRPPEVDAWMAKNPWYHTDPVMNGAADAIAKQYLNQNPAALSQPMMVLDHVEAMIKKEFPNKFNDRQRPAAVADPAKTGTSETKGKKPTVRNLSPEQRKIAQRFASTGVMSEQDYVDQLVQLGELS